MVSQFKERDEDKTLVEEKRGRNQKSVFEQASPPPLTSKCGVARIAIAREDGQPLVIRTASQLL
jgi:hypothetical protein